MWETFKEVLKGILSSKKGVATITGAVVAVGAKLGLSEALGTQVATIVVTLVSTYVIGQGAADLGKEKAKVEATEKAKKEA